MDIKKAEDRFLKISPKIVPQVTCSAKNVAIYLLLCKARIPPETVFALTTRFEEKVHKQHKIDTPYAKPKVLRWGLLPTCSGGR